MQNDFVTGSLGTKEAQAIIPKAKEVISNFEGDILVTMDTHYDDYLETQEGKLLPVIHCIRDTDGWQLEPEIQEAVGDAKVFIKETFGSIELAQYIKDNKYDSITLIGICTDICVVSNALLIKAFNKECPIKVISSSCAGVTPESHDSALETMRMCQIDVQS